PAQDTGCNTARHSPLNSPPEDQTRDPDKRFQSSDAACHPHQPDPSGTMTRPPVPHRTYKTQRSPAESQIQPGIWKLELKGKDSYWVFKKGWNFDRSKPCRTTSETCGSFASEEEAHATTASCFPKSRHSATLQRSETQSSGIDR